MEEKNKTIGEYKIEKQIAVGSVGATFVVQDPITGCRLAVKCLRPPQDESVAAKESVSRHKERFAREVQAMIKLDHPSIVRIYDCNLDSDNPYYVMEYCRGGSLEQVLRKGLMSPSAVLKTIWPICSALHYAHSQGVLHRDIKPGNILFGTDGKPRISDFGMCRIADWHTLTCGDDSMLGTLYYLPPEQAQDPRSVDVRGDIFSLGRTIRHMLVGSAIGTSLPSSTTSSEKRKRQLKAWDGIVTALTAFDPSRRPPSMRQVAVLLDRVSKNLLLGSYAREMRHTLLASRYKEHPKTFIMSADEFSRIVSLVGLTGFGEMRHFMGTSVVDLSLECQKLLTKYAHMMMETGADGPLAAFVLLSAAGKRQKLHLGSRYLLEAQRIALRTVGREAVRFIRHMFEYTRRRP